MKGKKNYLRMLSYDNFHLHHPNNEKIKNQKIIYEIRQEKEKKSPKNHINNEIDTTQNIKNRKRLFYGFIDDKINVKIERKIR